MLLSSLLLIPLIGVILISSNIVYLDKNAESTSLASSSHMNSFLSTPSGIHHATSYSYKIIALVTSIVNLAISLVIFIYLILVIININLYKNIMIWIFLMFI